MAVAESMIGAGAAARRLGISTQCLGELAKSGRIEFETTPYGQRVFSSAAIEALKEEREAVAAARAESA